MALLLAYALPLFAPPAAAPVTAPPADAGLLARLFPGVPGWWVALRLACLAAGATWIARLAPAGAGFAAPARAREAPHVAPWSVAAALACAAVPAVLAPGAEHLGRAAQAGYFALLWLPAGVLAAGTSGGPRGDALSARSGLALGAVLVLWLALRAPLTWHAPRAAVQVDTWRQFEWLVHAVYDGSNLLTESSVPGSAASYMFWIGVPLLGDGGFAPTLAWLQAWNMLWLAASAACVAALAGALVDRRAVPVAAAACLFSAYTASMTLSAMVLGVLGLYVGLMGVLLLAFHRSGSPAALAALGVTAGLAALQAQVALFALLAPAAALWMARRGPRPPAAAWAIAALGAFAAAWPALPDLADVRTMIDDYVATQGEFAGLQDVLLGQRSVFEVPALWQAGRAGALDVPLGALLAPFATPRTAVRLWGDLLLEPAGAALAAVGIAVAVRLAWTRSRERWALAVLALAFLPGFTSSVDRASLTRILGATLLLALFTAVGFDTLRRLLAPRGGAAAAAIATTAIAVGGMLAYDVVNPRVLPSSALAIALAVVKRDRPDGGVAVLEHAGPHDLRWLYVRPMAFAIPRRPLPVLAFRDAGSAADPRRRDRPAAEVLFFSPSLEHDAGVVDALCARWPDTAIYTFEDRARIARVYAARPAGGGWEPDWPVERWSARGCAERSAS